jgi:hypothetical protein
MDTLKRELESKHEQVERLFKETREEMNSERERLARETTVSLEELIKD